ncbi:MAG: dihydrolipoyl dehydrogenase [Chloroflexi bacterium]|nr:dihydrolipoyl dehydrogenase [Chloroflexota bacterium]
MAEQYDVIVIGSGPGGYVAAIRAAQLGLKTACVEVDDLGGVCLNWGCIPSKTLLANAELVNNIRNHARDFGLKFDNFEADYEVAVKRSRRVVKKLTGGVGFLFKKYGVEHIKGYGTIKDIHTVTVEGTDYSTKNIVIATGATWNRLPDVGAEGEIDDDKIVAYRQAIVQETIPNRVVIVGGSVIGVEFASVYAAYGAEVTIVEYLPRLIPFEDSELSAELTKIYQKRGINVLAGHAVKKALVDGDAVKVTVETVSSDGEQQVIETDRVLVALGVKPNSSNIGLENVGVKTDKRGNIIIDDHMRTNVANIYAIGDVTGKLNLAHGASHMGVAAVELIGGLEHFPLDYRMMPRPYFCNPNIAALGWTEDELKEQGIEYNVGRFPLSANGKALGANEPDGWIKILAGKQYGEILGAHMIGHGVTEMISEFSLAHELESTPTELFSAVHPHPTISEAIGEAARDVEGTPINF